MGVAQVKGTGMGGEATRHEQAIKLEYFIWHIHNLIHFTPKMSTLHRLAPGFYGKCSHARKLLRRGQDTTPGPQIGLQLGETTFKNPFKIGLSIGSTHRAHCQVYILANSHRILERIISTICRKDSPYIKALRFKDLFATSFS